MSSETRTAIPDPILFPGEGAAPQRPVPEQVPQFFEVPLDTLVKYGLIGIDLTIQKANPSIIFDAATAGDTDWWMGSRTNGSGTSNDPFELGLGTVTGTTPLWRYDKDGIMYSIAANPQFYMRPSDSTTNYTRIEAVAEGATYIKVDWVVRSQTYGAIWHLIGYRGNTGANATRDTLAIGGDANMDISFGSASKVFAQAGTGVTNFALNAYMGPTRSFNFVRSDTTTVLRVLAFDGTNEVRVGPVSTSSVLALMAGSTTAVASLATGTITLADSTNFVLNSTNGTKIGTATTQKLGFFNAGPVVQPATTGTTTGFTAGLGTPVLSDSTFTGNTGSAAYTIGDIVLALKQLGLLAA